MPIEPATSPDPLLPQARALLLAQQNPSVALLQRVFKIGHKRATSLMQSLESDIVTPPDAQGWRRMMSTGNQAHDAPGYSGPPRLERHQRLCFYPSSGDRALWVLLRLDCDFFLLSEQERRAVSWRRIQAEFAKRKLPATLIFDTESALSFHSQGKTVLILIQDNNDTLTLLRRSGLHVHHFVGICDGCCEGGNHECVHERPFLSRLLPLAANGMVYTTDHSRPLQRELLYPCGNGHHPRFLSGVYWRDFSEPPNWNNPKGPDLWEQTAPSTCFELQGVLALPDEVTPVGGKLREADLTVLPKGPHPTQLEQLKPLRTLYGSGLLAEYRVIFENQQP